MTYIVITAHEVEANSINEAAEKAMESLAHNGAEYFVQVANAFTRSSLESALDGAELVVDR